MTPGPSPWATVTELLIFPCNGNGIEALDCMGATQRCIGFIDDEPARLPARVHGHAVLDRQALARHAGARVLAVPGGPRTFAQRARHIDGLQLEPSRFATVVHPSACVSPRATLGRNVLVMAGVVVSGNAVVGDHVCLLPNTVVSHDARIGAFTLVGSNVSISGNVEVEEGCYIGSGSSVIDGVRIGRGALVGLGSTVIRDVAPGAVVAGTPAIVLR